MMNAAQSVFDADKQKFKFPPPGTMKKPMKIPAQKQLYADCIELYAKKLPKDKNSGMMLFFASGIYYDFGNYKEGNKKYFSFIKRYTKDPNVPIAAARLFEYYKNQKEDKDYNRLKKKLAKIPSVKSNKDLAYYFNLPEPKKKNTKKKKKKKLSQKKKKKPTPKEAKKDSQEENDDQSEEQDSEQEIEQDQQEEYDDD